MHAQLGIAERVIQTLKKKAMVLLQMSRLPADTFYVYALDHAVTLYNRTFHSSLKEAPIKILKPNWTLDPKRFVKLGSTVFYKVGKSKTTQAFGVYIGECSDSTEHTIKIFSGSKRIVRRNATTVKFDETYLSRHRIPELHDTFLSADFLTFQLYKTPSIQI